jgi:putative phosphoesterase
MQIGILSDTHSRYQTVETALALLQARNVNFLVHCGDIEDAETVWLFQGFTTHFTFGNCDTERTELRQAIHGIGATLHESWGHLELDGLQLAFTHGDDKRLLHELEQSGTFDYIFHGHTHQAVDYRNGSTRIINPGALQRARAKTFVVLDVARGEAESVVVE